MVATAIISSLILNAYSSVNAQTTDNGEKRWTQSFEWAIGNMSAKIQSRLRWEMRGKGYLGFIEVSEEFKENVVNIAKNDPDVQNLLNEGYNITGVRPLIKTIVEGDGSVVAKATGAILMLEKDATSHATAMVDLEEAKVTEIIILTRMVIEKP